MATDKSDTYDNTGGPDSDYNAMRKQQQRGATSSSPQKDPLMSNNKKKEWPSNINMCCFSTNGASV